jgi:hypothetical protein
MCLPAKIFTLGLPLLRPEHRRFRVAATGFEIVWMNEGDSSFTATLDFEARVDLASIGRFARTLVWMALGPVDVQVWVKGDRLVGGVLQAEPVQSYDWRKVLDIVDTLESLPSDAELPRPCASVADIAASAKDLYLMHEALSDSDVADGIPAPAGRSDRIHRGALLLDGPGRQPDRLCPGRKKARCRCRYAERPPATRPDATETRMRMMSDDYRHHLSSMAAAGTVMELNDFAEFVRAMKGE